MNKDGSEFAKPNFIENEARLLFEKLSAEQYLRHTNIEDIVPRLAEYYGNLNSLHPFREGNGRTQRLFFRQLLAPRGLWLKLDEVTAGEKVAACAASHRGD